MFNDEELIVIKSCLLVAKQTFKFLIFKNKDVKEVLKEIDKLLEKF